MFNSWRALILKPGGLWLALDALWLVKGEFWPVLVNPLAGKCEQCVCHSNTSSTITVPGFLGR